MEGLVKGNVLVVSFPYSDFTQQKRRPVLVLAVLPGNDLIVCRITSQQISHQYAILIRSEDLLQVHCVEIVKLEQIRSLQLSAS